MSNPYVTKALSLGAQMVYADGLTTATWTDQGPGSLDLSVVGATVGAGPGLNLSNSLALDGADDHARYPTASESAFDLGATGDGWHSIAFWVRTFSAQNSFDTAISKGDTTYQVRRDGQTSDGWRRLRYDARGGSGGNVGAGPLATKAAETWYFCVAQQDDIDGASRLRIRLFNSDGTLFGAAHADRAGTVGVNTASRFVVGAQDNNGTLRRFWGGSIAGVCLFPTSYLTLAQMDELRTATFDEGEPPEPVDTPTGLTVDGTSGDAVLNWTSAASEFVVERERWVGTGAPN